jgi:tagatose-1,6-bisphosphate aldolase non-catalytic subunit AgaZ/GatZ
MFLRNDVVPKQVLFEVVCTDYQDEHAYPALAQAAENLMRVGCESTSEDTKRV